MKPRTPHPRRRPIAEMNLIPYIDVMLVLLVIFMVATPLIMQGIQVTLPEAASPTLQPKDNKPLIVSVNATGQYYINLSPHPREPIAANQLASVLRPLIAKRQQAHEEETIYIQGDKTLPYGQVMALITHIEQAGGHHIALMTENAPE